MNNHSGSIDRFIQNVAQRYFLVVLSLLLFLGFYHIVMIVKYGVTFINGSFYALISDDMMISMRYAKNLADGFGLVFNPGDRVEGITNPLLTFFLAMAHCFPATRLFAGFFLQLLNLLLSLGILYVLSIFWGKKPASIAAGIIAAISYATFPGHAYFSYIGFEVYLVSFILLYSFWRIECLNFFDALVLGFLPLAHSMALVPWAILSGAIFFVSKGPLKRRFFLFFFSVLPFFCYESFRIAYFKDFLPNTYWLKIGAGIPISELWQKGFFYVKDWAKLVFLLIIFASYEVFITIRSRKSILAALLIVGYVVSVMGAGGDIFSGHRFLFPVSVLLAALAGRGVIIFIQRLSSFPRSGKACLMMLVCASLIFTWTFQPVLYYRQMVPALEHEKTICTFCLFRGLLMRDILLPGETVAAFGIGYLGYYSDHTIMDMLGKVDKHIARVLARPNKLTGHNKTDFDYVFARNPDFVEVVIDPRDLADTERLRRFADESAVAFFAQNALHPIFRSVYADHPLKSSQGYFMQLYAKNAMLASRRSLNF